MPDTITAPTRQFLEWIAAHPRAYAEVLDTWRSSCPRLTVWEDACIDGQVRLEGGPAGFVVLTSLGRAALGPDQTVRSPKPAPSAACAAASRAIGTR